MSVFTSSVLLLCRLCEKAGDELSQLFLPQMAHYQYVLCIIHFFKVSFT